MQGGKTLVCSSGFSSKGGCRFARVLPRGGVQTPPSLLFLGKTLSKICVSLARGVITICPCFSSAGTCSAAFLHHGFLPWCGCFWGGRRHELHTKRSESG